MGSAGVRAKRTTSLACAALAVCAAIGAGGCVQQGPSASDAFEQLASAVRSGNDASVTAMLEPRVASAILASGTTGAAARLHALYPSLASMHLSDVAATKASVVDTWNADVALTLSKVGNVWRVTSARYTELETTRTPLSEAPVEHKTKNLPAGMRVVVRQGAIGARELTYVVHKVDGVEQSRTNTSIIVAKTPAGRETWVGTGKRVSADVSKLRTGSKFNRGSHGVTNDSKVVDGRKGTLATSFRVNSPHGGSKVRVVLLGPDETELDSDATRMRSGYDWWDGVWWWDSAGGFEPTGTWVVVAEVDGRPAKWKVFRVK